jgi:hypothetical protein
VVIVAWSQYPLRYAVICDSETFEATREDGDAAGRHYDHGRVT